MRKARLARPARPDNRCHTGPLEHPCPLTNPTVAIGPTLCQQTPPLQSSGSTLVPRHRIFGCNHCALSADCVAYAVCNPGAFDFCPGKRLPSPTGCADVTNCFMFTSRKGRPVMRRGRKASGLLQLLELQQIAGLPVKTSPSALGTIVAQHAIVTLRDPGVLVQTLWDRGGIMSSTELC